MGWPFGERALALALEQLENDLIAFYGALTELRNGLRADVPEKPDALTYTEQIQKTQALPYAGGILDQPYLFMREYKKCLDITLLFERQWQAASQGPKAG